MWVHDVSLSPLLWKSTMQKADDEVGSTVFFSVGWTTRTSRLTGPVSTVSVSLTVAPKFIAPQLVQYSPPFVNMAW